MKIMVNNVGDDQFVGPTRRLAVNAVDVTIFGRKYQLPAVVPNKIELQYSETSGTRIDDSIIQSVQRIYDISEIRNPVKNMEIVRDYNALITRKPHSLIDFYLQYPQDNVLTNSDRDTIHKIQHSAGATIISDYETNREQNINTFTAQILEVRRKYPRHVVCPTLDVGMKTEGLFGKKLDVIINKGFDRFNVIYRSIPDNLDKWVELSAKIHGKGIWCNVVGISPRWYGKTTISNAFRVFLFGVHTISAGYPWIGAPNARSFVFNGNTVCYDLASNGVSYEESRSVSLREQRQQLVLSRQHIINRTYFATYVPPRRGLVQTLASIV